MSAKVSGSIPSPDMISKLCMLEILCRYVCLHQCMCHGYFVKYDNYIYSPANIYNVHAISQYMKLTLWHHTINTALALDKFLIKAPPPHAH